MGNSGLVSYTKISPNRTSPRNSKIDTITIHVVVGQLSVETLGNIFAPESRKASSNYGIGADGRIAMYVEEKDRSWCSSNAANDHRAITIECASDLTHPYKINDKVYNSLIKLCADIVKRNGMGELRWKNDKNLIGVTSKQNMTVHRWFSNTACPGEYLMSKMGQIAKDVNDILGKKTVKKGKKAKKSNSDIANEVIAGKWGNGEDRRKNLTKAGYDYTTIQNLVNKKLQAPTKKPRKSVNDLAREVIAGKWGNGEDRRKRLTKAGYNYSEVQRRVNTLLR